MTTDMNAEPFEDGQTISKDVLKAWMATKTDVVPLSARWNSILEKRGEIQVDGWTYFFKAVKHDKYLVRRFATEEVTDFHRNFYGGRLTSRMFLHFIFQNSIFVFIGVFLIGMIVWSATTFTRDGAIVAFLWFGALLVFLHGLRTLR